MEVVDTSDRKIFNGLPQFPTPQSRSRGNSVPQVPQEGTTVDTTMTDTKDFSQQDDSRRKRYKRNCYCNLEPTLREVKASTSNKGRFFWSCRKFGGPNHLTKCKFFRWDDSQDDDETELPAAVPSSSFHPNPHTDSNNDNRDHHNHGEVNLSSHLDRFLQTRKTSTTTPPITLHRRVRNTRRRASLPQTPGSPPTGSQSHFPLNTSNDTITTTNATRNLTSNTSNVYTHEPTAFDNWDDVPKYSISQLLDIMQNHLVQQDDNHQKWYNASQSAKQDLEDVKKEMEKLKRDFEVINKENKLYRREINVLRAEKRLLKLENDGAKEEIQELKRRR